MKTLATNNRYLLAGIMAYKDWTHEFGLSICSVVALASILAPLLILHGVHSGIVERLRENLMRDPFVLVLIPQGSRGAGFNESQIAEYRALPGVNFAIGRVRDVAAEIQVVSSTGKRLTIPLDATADGDPVFGNFNLPTPRSAQGSLEIALSASAARKLAVDKGQIIKTVLSRKLANGKLQRLPLEFKVAQILPSFATGQDSGFVDMDTLLAIQDFRDGVASDLLATDGDRDYGKERYFESFRVYAKGLTEVEDLEKWFLAHDINVKTRARDIAAIRKIDSTLGTVITLIAAAGVAGFFSFMGSSAESAVRRKWKQIGMLKLTGYQNSQIVCFVLCGALLTGVLGTLAAFAIYGVVAYSIDLMFSAETGGESVCVLTMSFSILAFLAVQAITIMASGRAAVRAARISPATAIRSA